MNFLQDICGRREHHICRAKHRDGYPRRCFSYVVAPVCLLALTNCIGCGAKNDGFRVSGKVTYDGRPVPLGRIVFEPDVAKGNAGPQGFALITRGEFDTASPGAKGVLGGPMVVKIDAFDGKSNGAEGSPMGTPLLPSANVRQLDLPKADSTHDFEIPRAPAAR